MALKKLCTFLLMGLFMLNMYAQDEAFDYEKLVIATKQNGQKTADRKHFKGKEASEFDVTAHINQNFEKAHIFIKGKYTNKDIIVSTIFNSSNYNLKDMECPYFCEKTLSVSKAPFLGVAAKGMDDFKGVQLARIVENTAAERAGFQIEDIITHIDDIEIRSACDFTSAIASINPGQLVDIEFIRNNVTYTKPVTMGYKMHKKITWEPCCESPVIEPILDNNMDFTVTEINSDLNLFPNPTDGLTQVIYNSNTKENVQLIVTDVNGKVLIDRQIKDFDGRYEQILDLNKYSEGVYFLNILQADQVHKEKIVLQKS